MGSQSRSPRSFQRLPLLEQQAQLRSVPPRVPKASERVLRLRLLGALSEVFSASPYRGQCSHATG